MLTFVQIFQSAWIHEILISIILLISILTFGQVFASLFIGRNVYSDQNNTIKMICLNSLTFFLAFIALPFLKTSIYAPLYFIFFTALITTIITDFQEQIISRYVSLYLVPLGFIASYFEWLPISLTESIVGTLFGYFFLFFINKIFYFFKKQDGLGQGDLDLMAFIGSFTGFFGCWFSILFGSALGTFVSCLYMVFTKKEIKLIPFGPFLAIGTFIFVIFEKKIMIFFNII